MLTRPGTEDQNELLNKHMSESSTSDSTDAQQSQQQQQPQQQQTKAKSVGQSDEELREKLERMSGEGGASGIEYEDGQPNTMKRSVRNNMFRYIWSAGHLDVFYQVSDDLVAASWKIYILGLLEKV